MELKLMFGDYEITIKEEGDELMVQATIDGEVEQEFTLSGGSQTQGQDEEDDFEDFESEDEDDDFSQTQGQDDEDEYGQDEDDEEDDDDEDYSQPSQRQGQRQGQAQGQRQGQAQSQSQNQKAMESFSAFSNRVYRRGSSFRNR